MKINKWILLAAIMPLGVMSCAKKDENKGAAQMQEQPQEEQTDDGGADPVEITTPAPQPAKKAIKYPIVYHHGFMDSSKNRESNAEVSAAAKTAGAEKIFYTEVSPANTIEYRAAQLAAEVDRIISETKVDKVNIIAHSLGGLDARYMISSMGYEDRVASLTMVGTPNRGTPVAQLIIDYSPEAMETWIENLVGFAGGFVSSAATDDSIDVVGAFENLTEDYMENEFNPANPDSDQVYYQSWAGKTGFGTGHSANKALAFSSTLLMLRGGANDGIVHESSARWGDYRGSVKADHIDLSGRQFKVLAGDGFNFPKFIELNVKHLLEKGY